MVMSPDKDVTHIENKLRCHWESNFQLSCKSQCNTIILLDRGVLLLH